MRGNVMVKLLRRYQFQYKQKKKSKSSFSLKTFVSFFTFVPILFLLVCSQLFIVPARAATGINKQINFQGKLVDNNGLNVADSTYTVVFSIYNVSSGGTATWTESDSVTTSNGIFQVALGAVTSLPGSIDFNQDTWYVGIKVNSDAEMTPRVRLAAVPYAFNAGTVDGLNFSGTSGNSYTLPSINNGTIITSNASTQGLTSTQTSGTILGITDSTAETAATTGLSITMSGTGAFDQTGLSFNLSNASGTNLNDVVGSGGTWKISRAGALTVTSCSGCGSGGSTSLNGITAATATSTIANGNNAIVWNWTPTTAGSTDFTFGTTGAAPSSGTNTALSVTLGHTSNTFTNAFLVSQTGSGGITTNGIQISQTAGTLTNGLLFSGTIGTDITTATNRDLTISPSGTGNLILDTNGGNVGIGTTTPTSTLSVGGDVTIGTKPTTANTAMQTWIKLTGTAGTIGGSNTAIASISAAVMYNGSLYIGTNKTGQAEIYRYNGPTLNTWTQVSGTAGTVGGNTTTAIDMISSLTVYNGYLYAGTTKTDSAEVYKYNGGSSWTELNPTGTAGKFLTTTTIDGVSSMAVFGGRLFIGTRESARAEIYMYNGGTNWVAVNGTAGTFVSTNTVGMDAVTQMVVVNNQLIAGIMKNTGDADVVRWNGIVGGSNFFALNLASITGSYLIDNTAQTGYFEVTSMAVWAGKLVIGLRRGVGQADILMYQEPPAGAAPINSWTRLNNAVGTITSGGTASIDSVTSLAVYGGRLYAGTNKANAGEIYRYDEGKSWTRVSSNTSGQIASNGTSSIDGISVLIPMSNNSLFAGTAEPSAAEGYTYQVAIDQSYALQFDAGASQGGGEQNSQNNLAQIYFVASLSANLNNKAGNTGSFVFTNSIVTNNGSYDVAEDYPTRDDTLEPGDVVSIETNERGFVRKSSGVYDYSVIGVYSSQPALRLSQDDVTLNGGRAIPIALAGRVPVKVSTENGTINAGDYLTSSSTPGVAMKAKKSGIIIGQAMEGYDGSGIGQVLVYIKSTTYNGNIAQTFTNIDMNSSTLSEDILNSLMSQGTGLGNSEMVTDRLVAGLEVITPKITADTITAKTIKADQIEGLDIFTTKISSLQQSVMGLQDQIATDSSLITQEASSSAPVYNTSLVLQSLSVDGLATVSADLRVEGNGLIEGIMHIADTLTTNNFIVNGLSDFFGSVMFHNNVTFANTPVFSPDTAGNVVIKKGTNSINITFTKDYPTNPIVNATISIIQNTSTTDQNALEQTIFSQGYQYIVTNISTKGFTILLNKNATDDIPFSWTALTVGDSSTLPEVQSSLTPIQPILTPTVTQSTNSAQQNSP